MRALIQLLIHFGWYAGLVIALHLLERFWPAGPQASRKEQLFNFALAAVAAMTTTVLLDLGSLSNAIRQMLGFQVGAISQGWQPTEPWEWMVGSLAYLLIFDLFQYWFHRIQHMVPQLWNMHALHHDTEAVEASASLRNTIWHHIGTIFVVTLPLLVIAGDKIVHPYAAWVFLIIWGFYNHANVRWSHGPLTAVISGPQLHRLHHRKASEYYNCNYAALFPAIDMIFGTYKAPRPGEFPETGLIDRKPSGGGVREFFLALLGRGNPR